MFYTHVKQEKRSNVQNKHVPFCGLHCFWIALEKYEKIFTKRGVLMKKTPLIVAGIIFGLVALVHLARLYYHFPIIVGEWPVPEKANIIGFIVAGLLSIWMFLAAKKSNR
jgi:hypothetical protein